MLWVVRCFDIGQEEYFRKRTQGGQDWHNTRDRTSDPREPYFFFFFALIFHIVSVNITRYLYEPIDIKIIIGKD